MKNQTHLPVDNRVDDLALVTQSLPENRDRFPDAFGGLVKRYQGNVMALALNILGPGAYDDALDVVQETFVQAYMNLERFDMGRNFKSWLLGIAVKRALDHLKKQRSFLNYFKKQTRDPQAGQFRELPKNRAIQESVIFSPLLKRLKEKERIALVLRVNEDFTAKEIAAVLGCSQSTARVHLFNAKQALRRYAGWQEPEVEK